MPWGTLVLPCHHLCPPCTSGTKLSCLFCSVTIFQFQQPQVVWQVGTLNCLFIPLLELCTRIYIKWNHVTHFAHVLLVITTKKKAMLFIVLSPSLYTMFTGIMLLLCVNKSWWSCLHWFIVTVFAVVSLLSYCAHHLQDHTVQTPTGLLWGVVFLVSSVRHLHSDLISFGPIFAPSKNPPQSWHGWYPNQCQ